MPKVASLISAYVLDGQGGGKRVGWDEIAAWQPAQGLLWVHLDFTSRKTQRWLKQQSGLDRITIASLIVDESRPRSIISPEGIFVSLRGVNHNPGQDPEDMVSIRIWIEPNRIITTRRRCLLSIEDMRTAIEESQGPKTTSEFLITLNSLLTNRMADVLEGIDDRVDALEELMMAQESRLLRPKIADLRRESILIRRYLSPQREALYRLQIEETPLLDQTARIHLREATDRIIRYIEDLDSARDRATITHEELSSRLSEQLDKRMYVLSVVAVVFLPLTFITGLLGINVAGIPGANDKWAFLIVCTILIGIAVVMLWFFKRRKWM